VMLMEKAWAKLHGSYSIIIGGTCTEAMKCLARVATHHVEHKDTTPEELWKILSDGGDRNFLMETSTGSTLSSG
jgi:hypothetical protein